MRLFIVNLLATALLVGSASASKASTLSAVVTDLGATVEVALSIDTEGTTNITILGIGILFDPTVVEFDSGATTSTSYLFYVAGKAAYLAAAGAPALRFGTDNQVNTDFTTTDLLTLQNGSNVGGAALIGTLVFNVLGAGDPDLSITLARAGNEFQLCSAPGDPQFGVGAQPCTEFQSLSNGLLTATQIFPLLVTVPEPGVAGLSLAALLAIGALRTRNRRRQ